MSSSREVGGPTGSDQSAVPTVHGEVPRDPGVETIRSLLRKLEEAAAELPQDCPPAQSESAKQAPGLASLSASRTRPLGDISTDLRVPAPIELSPPVRVGEQISKTPPTRKLALTIGAGSFALGAAAAGLAVVVLGLNPFAAPPQKASTVALAPGTAATTAAGTDASKTPQPATRTTELTASARSAEPSPPEASVQQTASQSATASSATSAPSQPEGVVLANLNDVLIRPGDQFPFNLPLSRPITEKDRLLIVFRDVPAWLTLTKGSTIRDGLWLLPAHQSADLALLASAAARGTATIELAIARPDGHILSKANVSVSVQPLASDRYQVATAQQQSAYSAEQVLARGQLLLDTGEIEAGRTLLRAAAEGGSVTAALKLAQTYDPAETERLGLSRNSADTSLAMRWYERAQAMGSQVAAARLSALSMSSPPR